MASDTVKTRPELDVPINAVQTVRERIVHLRRLMMVHSYIYYWMNDNVVSDDQWQTWANTLRDLQALFGWEGVGYFDSVFKDWDGSTGCDLPKDPRTANRARWLIRERDRANRR